MRRGFTLIELMIVIAIIGILTSVLIPAFKKKPDAKPQDKPATTEIRPAPDR